MFRFALDIQQWIVMEGENEFWSWEPNKWKQQQQQQLNVPQRGLVAMSWVGWGGGEEGRSWTDESLLLPAELILCWQPGIYKDPFSSPAKLQWPYLVHCYLRQNATAKTERGGGCRKKTWQMKHNLFPLQIYCRAKAAWSDECTLEYYSIDWPLASRCIFVFIFNLCTCKEIMGTRTEMYWLDKPQCTSL